MFGVANVVAACVVVVGIFFGLPARWWPVDVSGALVATGFAVAGGGLLARARWAPRLAKVVAIAVLIAGLVLVICLATAVGWLSAIHGPVGRGGTIVVVLVVALVVPYLVVLPAAELVWLHEDER